MSPNEDQLRAALREGEGDRPNADLIIASVRAARRSRRRVAWAIAGSVAVVIAIGGGVTALSMQRSGTSSTSSGAGAGGSLPVPTSAAGAARAVPPAAGPQMESSPTGARPLVCPDPPPTVAMPNISNGRLLPDGITAIRICLYQVGRAKLAGTTELTGPAAEHLAGRLENSPLPTPTTACTADLGPTVVVLASTAQENTPTIIGNLGGCGEITNGQAARLARAVLQDEARVILRPPGSAGVNSPGPGPS
jgi:hypothetical protein